VSRNNWAASHIAFARRMAGGPSAATQDIHFSRSP
jgi:hypothetical protein